MEFSLDATAGRTYTYAILVEGTTSQVVKSECVAHVSKMSICMYSYAQIEQK